MSVTEARGCHTALGRALKGTQSLSRAPPALLRTLIIVIRVELVEGLQRAYNILGTVLSTLHTSTLHAFTQLPAVAINPFSEKREPRLREVRERVGGHPACKQQGQDSDPGSVGPGLSLLNTPSSVSVFVHVSV